MARRRDGLGGAPELEELIEALELYNDNTDGSGPGEKAAVFIWDDEWSLLGGMDERAAARHQRQYGGRYAIVMFPGHTMPFDARHDALEIFRAFGLSIESPPLLNPGPGGRFSPTVPPPAGRAEESLAGHYIVYEAGPGGTWSFNVADDRSAWKASGKELSYSAARTSAKRLIMARGGRPPGVPNPPGYGRGVYTGCACKSLSCPTAHTRHQHKAGRCPEMTSAGICSKCQPVSRSARDPADEAEAPDRNGYYHRRSGSVRILIKPTIVSHEMDPNDKRDLGVTNGDLVYEVELHSGHTTSGGDGDDIIFNTQPAREVDVGATDADTLDNVARRAINDWIDTIGDDVAAIPKRGPSAGIRPIVRPGPYANAIRRAQRRNPPRPGRPGFSVGVLASCACKSSSCQAGHRSGRCPEMTSAGICSKCQPQALPAGQPAGSGWIKRYCGKVRVYVRPQGTDDVHAIAAGNNTWEALVGLDRSPKPPYRFHGFIPPVYRAEDGAAEVAIREALANASPEDESDLLDAINWVGHSPIITPTPTAPAKRRNPSGPPRKMPYSFTPRSDGGGKLGPAVDLRQRREEGPTVLDMAWDKLSREAAAAAVTPRDAFNQQTDDEMNRLVGQYGTVDEPDIEGKYYRICGGVVLVFEREEHQAPGMHDLWQCSLHFIDEDATGGFWRTVEQLFIPGAAELMPIEDAKAAAHSQALLKATSVAVDRAARSALIHTLNGAGSAIVRKMQKMLEGQGDGEYAIDRISRARVLEFWDIVDPREEGGKPAFYFQIDDGPLIVEVRPGSSKSFWNIALRLTTQSRPGEHPGRPLWTRTDFAYITKYPGNPTGAEIITIIRGALGEAMQATDVGDWVSNAVGNGRIARITKAGARQLTHGGFPSP